MDDKGGRLQDLESSIRFSLGQRREAYEEAFKKVGLETLSITETGWNALENTKFPFPSFNEWRQQVEEMGDLDEIQPDEQGQYQKEKQKYSSAFQVARQVAKETIAECSFLREYETACDDLEIDSETFALALFRSIMLTAV